MGANTVILVYNSHTKVKPLHWKALPTLPPGLRSAKSDFQPERVSKKQRNTNVFNKRRKRQRRKRSSKPKRRNEVNGKSGDGRLRLAKTKRRVRRAKQTLKTWR